MPPESRLRPTCLGLLLPLVAAAIAPGQEGQAPNPQQLRQYETPYYIIHSDLPLEVVREAAVRMTAMAEEYHTQTQSFSGRVSRRLPFALFSRREDYHAAGGLPGSAGMYNGQSLMAVQSSNLWHVVQHEGFHQFAHEAIRGDLPIWVNEGLAEYFAHAIWTGNGFVTGIIPPQRLRRVQAMLRSGSVLPFETMLLMTAREWSTDLNIRNYDQAWSMVHFLVHAEDGAYRQRFGQFVGDISRGRPWRLAFVARFGRDIEGFQEKYTQWWLGLAADPTAPLRREALVETLTTFLSRAQTMGLRFASAEEFFQSARDGKIELDIRNERLWLPPALLNEAVQAAGRYDGWTLDTAGGLPRLVLRDGDGRRFTGSFSYPHNRPPRIVVQVRQPDPPAASAPAPAAAATP